MRVFGDTNIGLLRSSNQDAYACGALDGGGQYAIVCDGMGGAAGGNVASEIATRIIRERIVQHLSGGGATGTLERLLEATMAAADLAIYDEAQAHPELEGMGTTVVTVVILGQRAYISHTGDSRVYLFREGALTQLTRDHSVIQEMLESGQLTEEQAKNHPRRHFITRALGVNPDESGEYDELELQPGDRLLLCTDGLTRPVPPEKIAALLRTESLETATEALIQAALQGGGPDNVTVVLMEPEDTNQSISFQKSEV